MAIPSSRTTLQTYCQRALGSPVVEINVDSTQIEDRTDEALQIYQEYHYDATERTYLKHKVTASTMTLASEPSATLEGKITGDSSGATATIHDKTSALVYRIKYISDTEFTDGEGITDANAVTATLASATAIVKGDIDNKYLPITDATIGIKRVIPFSRNLVSDSFFDPNYQLRLNELWDLSNVSMTNYVMTQQHVSMIDKILNSALRFEYNRHQDRLFLIIDWGSSNVINIDDYVIAEVFNILDPETYTDVYNDLWLKKYLTSLIKKQWGMNLMKFEGMQLPGGLTFNGRELFQQADQEIQLLEQDVQLKYELPLDFQVG